MRVFLSETERREIGCNVYVERISGLLKLSAVNGRSAIWIDGDALAALIEFDRETRDETT